MAKSHRNIVEELLEQYGNDPDVIGIRLLGSMARGEERPDSDVDIEIVLGRGREWAWQKKEKYGIHIDLILSSKEHLLHQFAHYPYLCFIDLDKKILLDRTGFLKGMQEKIAVYMKKHPQAFDFWNMCFREMKEKKSSGQKQKSLIAVFDDAERLFSPAHNVTRDWFRG